MKRPNKLNFIETPSSTNTRIDCNWYEFSNELNEYADYLEKKMEELWKNHLIDEIHPDAETAESKQYDKNGEIVAHHFIANLNLKDAEAH